MTYQENRLNMSVTLLVRINGKAGHGKLISEILEPVPVDNDIDNCFGMDVFTNNENPDEVLIVEKWSSTEAHRQFLSERIEAGDLEEMSKHTTKVSRVYYTEIK